MKPVAWMMVRFLQQYDSGEGDYTKERKQWQQQSIDAILAERQQGKTK